MKKWKKILAVLLCLLCVQVPAAAMTETVIAAESSVKEGLKKESGKYYFYVKGVRVKNTWKEVKTTSSGKTVINRYYFGKDGAAYVGKTVKGVKTPVLKKISGCYYAFDVYGRMLKGTAVINNIYYTFHNTTGKMTGLVKEGSKYYYYVGNQKAKNTFRSVKIKSNGKALVYKYYFGSNGAALTGSKNILGQAVPVVKKIGSAYYAFDINGRMLTGTYVINNQFYVFNSNGKQNITQSKKLRTASKYQANAAALRALLGKPKKTQYVESCYGDGQDVILYYGNFKVTLFKPRTGTEIVLGAEAL